MFRTERLAKKYKALMLDFTQPIFTRLKLEADLHVAETVRMMRLPGTINRKYKRDGAIARVIFLILPTSIRLHKFKNMRAAINPILYRARYLNAPNQLLPPAKSRSSVMGVSIKAQIARQKMVR